MTVTLFSQVVFDQIGLQETATKCWRTTVTLVKHNVFVCIYVLHVRLVFGGPSVEPYRVDS